MFSFLKNFIHQFVTGLTCYKFKFSWRKLIPVVLMVVIIFTIFIPVHNASADGLFGIFDIGNIALSAVLKVIGVVANLILWLSSLILTAVAFLFEYSVKFSIQNFTDLANNASLVNVGWTVIRDLSNIVFIFLILWVAISTILGLGSGDTMKSVLRIAIAALLINFSLFISKAVIDVANIVALHFYNLITDNGTGDIAGMFMNGLGLQTFFKVGALNIADVGIDTKLIFAALFGTIAVLVASWIFLAAAVMFVIRTIYLMVLMVLSPFAFIAWVVPGMSNHTHDWWHKLFHQAFFAPIFMIMIYIIGLAISGDQMIVTDAPKDFSVAVDNLSGSVGNAANFAAQAGTVNGIGGITLNFVMLIGMLVASLLVASKLGAVGASTAISLGNKIKGAGQSWVGGKSIGMVARNLDEKFSKTYFGNTGMGKTLRGWSTIALKDSKWGGKHSAEERHKEDLELASKRKEAAEVQGAAGAGLGKTWLGAAARKIGIEVPEGAEHNAEALAGKIEEVKTTGENAITLQDARVKQYAEAAEAEPTNTALQDALKREQDKLATIKQTIADELNKTRGELQKILVRLSPHSFVEMMPKNMLFTPEIMRNASRSQLMAVLGSDKFAEIEKDKVRAARYGHIKDASEKVKSANDGDGDKSKSYGARYDNYLKRSQRFKATVLASAGDNSLFNELGYDDPEKRAAAEEMRSPY